MANKSTLHSPPSPTPRVTEDVGDDAASTLEEADDGVQADSDDVWDPAAESHPRASSEHAATAKEIQTASKAAENGSTQPVSAEPAISDAPNASAGVVSSAQAPDWQAIYSAAHNAYYFYNSKTHQTTWTNPLESAQDPSVPTASSSSTAASSSSALPSSSSASKSVPPLPESADDSLALGIDPELAYLDPSLASSSATSGGAVPTFTAKFNAHTGRFAGGAAGARDPTHVSEYERAKRMSEAYFDVDAWKEDVEERENARKRAAGEEEYYGNDSGAKRSKKPSKADLERFREKKKDKKARKNAWLRE